VTIFVLLVVAGLCAVGVLRYWWTSRERDDFPHAPPPLIYPLEPSPPTTHANGNGAPMRSDSPVFRPVAVEPPRANTRMPLSVQPPRPDMHMHVSAAPPRPSAHLPVSLEPPRTIARTPVAVEPPPANIHKPVRPVDTSHDNTETVRFVRPTDVSVQLLPGRLEVIEGTTAHREIRFVRIPGEPVRVVLGREVGLTPHYIGLESPTVSRRHAQFDFTDNRWIVKNLSQTNPLVVNDDQLFDTDAARPLADGDRLELGEVVLRFHAQ
jgi:hypothetical protein